MHYNSSLALLSVVSAIGKTVLRKEVGLFLAWATWPEGASAPNVAVMCRGHGVPEMVIPASDSHKFKLTITLRRAQKFGNTGPYKIFDFLYNPLVFCNFS